MNRNIIWFVLFSWHASVVTLKSHHRLERRALEWFAWWFCTLLRMSLHRFRQLWRFPRHHPTPYSNADRKPNKQTGKMPLKHSELKISPFSKDKLTYMQAATKFSFVTHFHINLFVQTQSNQIEWFLYRNNLHLKTKSTKM